MSRTRVTGATVTCFVRAESAGLRRDPAGPARHPPERRRQTTSWRRGPPSPRWPRPPNRIELIGAIKPLLFNPWCSPSWPPTSPTSPAAAGDQPGQRLVPARTRGAGHRPPTRRPLRLHPGLAQTSSPTCGRASRSTSVPGQGQPALVRRSRRTCPPSTSAASRSRRRALAAATADVFFINGTPARPRPSSVIEDLRAASARPRAPLRFGLSAFVIARDTDDEAQAELEHLQALVDAERRPRDRRRHRPETRRCKGLRRHQPRRHQRRHAGRPRRQLRPRDRAHRRFHEAGIELFMLQFQPLEAELDRFADKVIPTSVTSQLPMRMRYPT